MLRKLKDEHIDMLFEAILSLKSVDECYDFFEDLCTIDEVQTFSKRIYAAKMLEEGKVYSEINEITGLSTATISRVNKCMKYGNNSYQLVLERLKKKNDNNV